MEYQFYKMQLFPQPVKGESFSKTVLVFSEDDPTYSELGYYDFGKNEWAIFGDFSVKLICWCYIPNPSDFIRKTPLKHCLHTGYTP